MQNATNRWMSSIILLAFFAIVAYAGRAGVQASNVVVTNSTSQPVPTTVQGTPNVRSLQGGIWSTYILGAPTVRVANTAAAPAQTVNVDQRGNTTQTFSFSSSAYSSVQALYAVPAGKRFVIEFVSVWSTSSVSGEVISSAQLTGGSGTTARLLVPFPLQVNAFESGATLPCNLVLQPQDTFGLAWNRTAASHDVQVTVTVTGRLIPA
jgi:hypothetical protein